MHEVFKRTITALALIVGGVGIYSYAPIYSISILLICMLGYVLCFEYYPLYRHNALISYGALSMIVSGFVALIYVNEHYHWLLPLPFILATLADTGGYIVGKLIGKHAIAPAISPKKTWEGFAGSCMLSYLGVAIWHSLFLHMPICPLYFTSIFVGVAFASVGLIGDLCISQLKRNAGAKDTGTLLPGHGGLLDRLDSVLAIALLLLFFIKD